MPRYKPTAEDEDLYGSVKPPGAKPAADPGGAPSPADPNMPPKPGEAEDPITTDQETAESMNSAVVDNKVLMGADGKAPREGDEIVLKVIKVYGNESEVAYSTTKPSEIGAGEGSMSSANSEIDAMDKPEMM
jgi:hypothetical protein